MYQENQTPNEEVLQFLRKRRNIYTIITVCCIVSIFINGFLPDSISVALFPVLFILDGIAAGCGMLCINQYRFEKSCGTKKGGGLWWICLWFFGLFAVPSIIAFLGSKVRILGELITGLKFQK